MHTTVINLLKEAIMGQFIVGGVCGLAVGGLVAFGVFCLLAINKADNK